MEFEPRRAARRTGRRWVATLAAALVLAAGLVGVTPSPAAASTVRPGPRFGQFELVLDRFDTQRVLAGPDANGLWAATVICWNAGIIGKVLSVGYCQAVVQSCTWRAYARNKLPIVSVSFWPYPRWRCSDY